MKRDLIPGLEVISGAMFAGKTEEIIRRIRRHVIAKRVVQVFVPEIDVRYGVGRIVSHSGTELDPSLVRVTALPADGSFITAVAPEAQVVAVDEAQFFGPQVVSQVELLVSLGRRVIVAGLALDYRGHGFGSMPLLLALADDVTQLYAVCVECGADATRTRRRDPSGAVVQIGGVEAYDAVCRRCYVSPV